MTVSILNLPIVLQEAVYLISTLLLYPVILALLILVVYLPIESETFVSEHYIRLKRKRDLTNVITARTLSKDGNFGDVLDLIRDSMSGVFVHASINDLYNIPVDEVLKVEIEKLLHEYDTLITTRLERTSLVARIGSILGLMGTLIPISPVLCDLVPPA